eukprot:226431_1
MPDTWGGPLVAHCHRLEHEVSGSMGAVFVYNGCDNNYNDYNNMTGSCNVDPDACFTSNPTTQPTIQPTPAPTLPQCSNGLTSPSDIEWIQSPTSPDILRTTLTFDVSTKTWDNGAISLTTRLYNDLLPAPTMRIQRGRTYEIVLVNNLGPERAENALLTGNQERDPNTTNLHTHGLHISPLSPADDALAIVLPGGNITYTYRIPCNHSGGVHYYHPHHHPSVQLQLAGGAAGAIIVEDEAMEEGLPDWYTDMRELVLFINHIDSTFIRDGYPTRTTEQQANQKVLYLTPRFEDVYLVNGEYQPTVCQEESEWIKFRFVHTEIRDPQKYQIGNDGECTLKLLTRDGVIINNPPRDVGNVMWLAESSRADVAITCNTGLHAITVLRTVGDRIIAYIHVDPATTTQTTNLTSFDPIRPSYLRDLRSDTVDNSLKMKMTSDSIVINDGSNFQFDANAPFLDAVNPIAINSINEWRLVPDDFGIHHPFHIHVNHFQVVAGPRATEPIGAFQSHFEPLSGWQEPGDYLDTIWGASTIRFMPDIWGGPLVVHCHRLEHEVSGSMGAVFVYNGCDNNYNDYNNMQGSCNVDPDACFTSNPTSQPTTEPTYNPTHIPTHIPTINPTKSPSNQPTIYPTLLPTFDPTNAPTNYPTNDPTINPSNNPTINPSNDPTFNPSNDPTLNPSNDPTLNPSYIPTGSPTNYPTHRPTIDPTLDPSLDPTTYPSVHPSSVNPSSSPTIAPSANSVLSTFETDDDDSVHIVEGTVSIEDADSYFGLRTGLVYTIMGVAFAYVLMVISCILYSRFGKKEAKHLGKPKSTRKDTNSGSQVRDHSSTFNVTITTTESPSTGPIFRTLNDSNDSNDIDSMDTIEEEDEPDEPSILLPTAPSAFKQWEKDYECKGSESSMSRDAQPLKMETDWHSTDESHHYNV